MIHQSNRLQTTKTMKPLAIIIVFFIGVCYGNPTPLLVPEDNSHYVEGESRFIWMNDDQGAPQLVDLKEPVEENLLRGRNRASSNRYFLFTRQNPNNPREIFHNDADSVSSSGYSANRPLVVLVHGWGGSINSGINRVVRSALLDVSDVNVIAMDWAAVADNNYVTSVAGVPNVGQFLGNFLVWLIDTTGSNWGNVHLVGFSLGAHVVGAAGRAAGNRPARITGLDPAGPLWHTNSNTLRASDGQYVEVIHTDGGIQGILNSIGDADFYPNRGTSFQPGCTTSGCSHGRAVDFFTATVSHDHLVGRECSGIQEALANACSGSALNMGNNNLAKRGHGIYGLQTEATWPF